MDSFVGHLKQIVKIGEGSENGAFIPGGLNSILQPLGISIINHQAFKVNIKNIYVEWMCEGERIFTP